MNEMKQPSFIVRAIKWFDPRWRSISTWGFIVNRITALGLTLYLFLHLTMLGNLARGAEAYNSFISMVHNPVFIFGEVLVVAAGLIHGLNGVRIGLNSFGVAVKYQKGLFFGLMIVAVMGSLYFAYRMFAA
jgi:succinate dehydrogenase / fumarate reductase cytochrome b subunit